MNVLVSGATGFLGQHLSRALEARGDAVARMSLLSFDDVTLYREQQYDCIFHLAAHTRAGDWCLTHSGEQWLVNQRINTAMLERWKEYQPQAKLITIGSSCAYVPGGDQREEDYLKGEPHENLYTYAMAKRMLLVGCEALHKQYGLRYLYIVPSTIYGPGYHTDGRQAHFIFDLVRKIIRGCKLGEKVVLWGDGLQHRELIHVDDLIRIILALNEEDATGIYNVTGEDGTIRGFAEEICRQVGYDVSKIVYDTAQFVGAPVKVMNTTKTDAALGGYKTKLVSDGIAELIKWYLETGAWR